MPGWRIIVAGTWLWSFDDGSDLTQKTWSYRNFRNYPCHGMSSNKYSFYIFCCWNGRTMLIILHRHSRWLWTIQNDALYYRRQVQERRGRPRRSPTLEIFRMQLAIDICTSIGRNKIVKDSRVPSQRLQSRLNRHPPVITVRPMCSRKLEPGQDKNHALLLFIRLEKLGLPACLQTINQAAKIGTQSSKWGSTKRNKTFSEVELYNVLLVFVAKAFKGVQRSALHLKTPASFLPILHWRLIRLVKDESPICDTTPTPLLLSY